MGKASGAFFCYDDVYVEMPAKLSPGTWEWMLKTLQSTNEYIALKASGCKYKPNKCVGCKRIGHTVQDGMISSKQKATASTGATMSTFPVLPFPRLYACVADGDILSSGKTAMVKVQRQWLKSLNLQSSDTLPHARFPPQLSSPHLAGTLDLPLTRSMHVLDYKACWSHIQKFCRFKAARTTETLLQIEHRDSYIFLMHCQKISPD